MPYGIPVGGIPNASVLVQASQAQKTNKNTGIGGRLLDLLIGSGSWANVGQVEAIVEVKEKPDYTIYYVVAGVIVLLGGIYFFTKKKK